jgi:ABC-type polysaccharide/polyol phosphate export permease
MAVATAPRPQRLGRLERSALTGVLVREVVNYSSYWRSSTFSSTVEPTIYLLAFGFGFGSLVSQIGGFDYVEFFGIAVAGFAKSFENFNYVVSAVLTPLFLVAGTFFPLDELPEWVQALANLNPLYHCVELVRHAAFGFEGWVDLFHAGALVAFGLVMWRIAIHAMTRKLIN